MKNTLPSQVLTAVIHTITWLLIIQLSFDLTGVLESGWGMFVLGDRFVDEAIILIPTLVGLFYWNSNYLVPNYLNRKFWWKYIAWLLISYLIALYLGYFIVINLFQNNYSADFEDPMEFYDQSLYLHLIVIGISASLGISKIAMKSLRQKEQAEELQRETELKFLNAQVIPHFLFNTLNGIYAQAMEEKAVKTTESVLQLSEIMRFPLKNISRQSISLTDEILFIEQYIRLQKLRLGEDYPIKFEKTGITEGFEIIPFTIIPIVENAFKYGVSQTTKLPIELHLLLENEILFVKASNRLVQKESIASFSIGIKNLNKRLALRYQNNYSLTTENIDNQYKVILEIRGKSVLN